MKVNDAVIIAVRPGIPHSYPIVKGQGVPGVVRAIKSGKADVAVRRYDGVTERLLVPFGALRKPVAEAAL
jgi:hypothetical protein